jgi:hypothetical protein
VSILVAHAMAGMRSGGRSRRLYRDVDGSAVDTRELEVMKNVVDGDGIFLLTSTAGSAFVALLAVARLSTN